MDGLLSGGDAFAPGDGWRAEYRFVVGYLDGRCLVSHGGSFPGCSLVITQGARFCQVAANGPAQEGTAFGYACSLCREGVSSCG